MLRARVTLAAIVSALWVSSTYAAAPADPKPVVGPQTIGLMMYSSVVDINGSTPNWKDALVAAVGQPNTTVRLAANVDMDLSGYEFIHFAQGVTLMGGQPCPPMATLGSGVSSRAAPSAPAATPRFIIEPMPTPICGGRTAQYPGPRLFTSTRPAVLLDIRCDSGYTGDNVRLTGFRLQGPHWDSADGDDNLEKGIQINSCNGVEISNMELSGWSGAAVKIVDFARRESGPAAVKVHDNFIHHNQHIGGNGYGVDVSSSAWALIEHNVFDFNRHAVTAGTIATYTGGYTANQNLVLKGGGFHGKWYEAHTQQFDVHGDNNCVDGLPSWLTPSGIWNCGRSGKEYHITNNAFQYTMADAFKLRGTPWNGAFVDNNVFAHHSVSDAVGTDGWGTIGLYTGPNTAGVDSFGKYHTCDFDRDGHDDLFMATGTSWWYMSSAKQHWVYLNSSTDLPDQVAVGDFEGTGRCDVFTVRGDQWLISRGGTGPLQSLGSFGVPFDQLRFGHFKDPHRTDIFRRAPDGQWWIISPGAYGWTPIQSSGFPLSQLHFGSFSGNGLTDVVALTGGQWSVSWGGQSPWQPLNRQLADRLDGLVIADLEGNGVDDIVRYHNGHLEASIGGRTTWQPLAPIDPILAAGGVYAGHFDGSPGAQLLVLSLPESPLISGSEPRRGRIFSRATGVFTPYGKYAY